MAGSQSTTNQRVKATKPHKKSSSNSPKSNSMKNLSASVPTTTWKRRSFDLQPSKETRKAPRFAKGPPQDSATGFLEWRAGNFLRGLEEPEQKTILIEELVTSSPAPKNVSIDSSTSIENATSLEDTEPCTEDLAPLLSSNTKPHAQLLSTPTVEAEPDFDQTCAESKAAIIQEKFPTTPILETETHHLLDEAEAPDGFPIHHGKHARMALALGMFLVTLTYTLWSVTR